MLAVRQVEARIVTFRRVLAYVKRYAPLTPGRPVAKLDGDAENTPR
jgi:hypothetical protein